jgi:protein phosphatase
MNAIRLKMTARTDMGLRRKNNEDNFVVSADVTGGSWDVPEDANVGIELGDKGCLLVVADGMGGANAGEVASAIAVDTVREMFTPENITENVLQDDSTIENFIEGVVEEADRRITSRSLVDKNTSGMGTTFTLAWILGHTAYVAWCGDSRIYSFHPQYGLTRLSKDHSLVQELVDSGKLKPEQADDFPYSNIITRSLGNNEGKAKADVHKHELLNDEIVLLCSDGLCGLCKDKQIKDILNNNKSNISALGDALIKAALDAGGDDNVTIALAQIMTGCEGCKSNIVSLKRLFSSIFITKTK